MKSKYKFVAIEGCIGAGKTSIVNAFEKNIKSIYAIYEVFENNPFLLQFYSSPKCNTLALELFFLSERYQQLFTLLQQKTYSGKTMLLSDYYVGKSHVFAKMNLVPEEYFLFNKIYNYLTSILQFPELVIFIQQQSDLLVNSIVNRGREYEKNITPKYLESLNDGYYQHFNNQNKFPVVWLNNRGNAFKEIGTLQEVIHEIMNTSWSPGLQVIDI